MEELRAVPLEEHYVSFNVLVHGLVEEEETAPEAQLTAEDGRRQAVVGADTPHGDDAVPPAAEGRRTAVLMELPFENMPRRSMFSLKEYHPENFTFVASFTLAAGDLASHAVKGVYFHNIGENWAVYFNGAELRSEIHLDADGTITRYRHLREVLIPLPQCLMKKGENIIAVRILGDPTNIDSGFHRSTPLVVGDFAELERGRSEQSSLVLIFLYLFFGVYHLFIFWKKRSEKYNFYYGAFSVLLFVYLFSRTHAVYGIIPDSTVLHRIEYCSLYALVPLFGAFADLLITGRYGRLTKLYGVFYAILAAVTVMPVSNPFAIDILRVWQVSVLVPLLHYTFLRIGAPAARQAAAHFALGKGLSLPRRAARALGRALAGTTAGNLLIGALVITACAVFDILDSMFWSYNIVLTTYGFFAFTMGITLILANRFIDIHNRMEETGALIRSEMDLAAHIQKSMLTPVPSGLADWDIALEYRPLFGPSGDFYDFYVRDRRLEGMAIFDVSGHGISSALVTMIVKPLTYRALHRNRGTGLDRAVGAVNAGISREIPGSENLISCIILRMKGTSVEYVNAGHPDLLHRPRTTGVSRVIDNGGTRYRGEPLGLNLSGEIPSVITFTVKKGDIILLYTDCLIESRNTLGEHFGIHRLKASLDAAAGATAREVLDRVVRDFDSFADPDLIRDDFTVIAARKK